MNARLDAIELLFKETGELCDLYTPLAAHLLPLRKERDCACEPMDGRVAYLCIHDWRNQFDAGINECMGFRIEWTE